jgi:hypothetical protein
MLNQTDIEIYPNIMAWLGRVLSGKFSNAKVDVRDTRGSSLNHYIRKHGLLNYFHSNIWQTYEIRVDITAFLMYRGQPGLVFVECKTVPISLLHISQLLGYSRVALPLSSYLISSKGIGGCVKSLITKYDRSDILEYQWEKGQLPRKIIIAKWDCNLKSIDSNSVLPPGSSGQL